MFVYYFIEAPGRFDEDEPILLEVLEGLPEEVQSLYAYENALRAFGELLDPPVYAPAEP